MTTIFVPDMTWIGLSLAVAGACWLMWRRTSAAVLLITGGAAILVFALNYSVIDTPVFLIPSLLVAWLLAAVGAEALASWLPARPWTGAATTALCLAIPAWLLATNFQASDRSRDTNAEVTLDRLFDALPDRASIVREDFLADRMVMAKLLAETASGRQIELAPSDSTQLLSRLEVGPRCLCLQKICPPAAIRRLRRELRAAAHDRGSARSIPVPPPGRCDRGDRNPGSTRRTVHCKWRGIS